MYKKYEPGGHSVTVEIIFPPSLSFPFTSHFTLFRRLAEAFHISDDSDPFNVRSSGSKFSDSLKEDARYVT